MNLLHSPTRRSLLAGSLALAAGARFGVARAAHPLVFGALNQQSLARTAARWNPVLAHLTLTTGYPFRLAMGPTVEDTNAMMARGEFDFVFTNINFKPEFDALYSVVARPAGPPIKGVIAVPQDSPAQRLTDLQGMRVAFPFKDAFVGYAVPMLALRRARVDVTAVFAGNQDAALMQLKQGQVQAAAVNSVFLQQFAQRVGLPHRALYTSEGFPDLPISAHPRVPHATVAAVRSALLDMDKTPAGRKALAQSEFTGFVAATEPQYASVRRTYRALD